MQQDTASGMFSFGSFFLLALPFQLPPATPRDMKAGPSGSCCHLRPSPASPGRRPCCRPLQTQHRHLLRAEPTTFPGSGPNLTFELRRLQTPQSLLSSEVVTAVPLLQSHSTRPLFTLPALSEPGGVYDGSAVSPRTPVPPPLSFWRLSSEGISMRRVMDPGQLICPVSGLIPKLTVQTSRTGSGLPHY